MLAIIGPLAAVLALAGLDVGAVMLHAYGWLRPIPFELGFVVIAIDLFVALGLLILLVVLAVVRHRWHGLLAVSVALLATIGLTAFNMYCVSMAILSAG